MVSDRDIVLCRRRVATDRVCLSQAGHTSCGRGAPPDRTVRVRHHAQEFAGTVVA
uniref:Uncharacterized protein n=1 Tax=Streptomyces sp. NBC_00003 TaxID=2903608 RepID=A0AAU2VG92_9ACTN